MSTSIPIVDLGGVPIGLAGAHPVADLLRAELGLHGNTAVRGTVTVLDGPLPPHDDATQLGPVSVSPSSVRFGYERSGIIVDLAPPVSDRGFSATVEVKTRPMPMGLPRSAFRWLEPTFHRPIESQAYVFIHMVLESLLLASAGPVVPLHAAAVERDGKAVLLTSSGGVGKTSTAMALVGSQRWRYLSDDITLLEAGRPVAPYRRLPMIYEYNLGTSPSQRKAVRSTGGMPGRLQWALTKPLHGVKRRRRVHPNKLYGQPVVADAAPAQCLAFLVRSPVLKPDIIPLGASEAVRRSISILHTEFDSVLMQLRLCEAAGAPPLVDPAIAAARANYERVFSEIPTICEVRIPDQGCAPAEVAKALERYTMQ